MATGTVKWFNMTKQFGFIQPTEPGPDIFVHLSDLKKCGIDELTGGETVLFEVYIGRSGKPAASKIEVV